MNTPKRVPKKIELLDFDGADRYNEIKVKINEMIVEHNILIDYVRDRTGMITHG